MTREVALTQALTAILDGDSDAACAAAMDPDGLALAMLRAACAYFAAEPRHVTQRTGRSPALIEASNEANKRLDNLEDALRVGRIGPSAACALAFAYGSEHAVTCGRIIAELEDSDA